MKKLIKGSLASKNEIARKVDEIVEWINEREKEDAPEEPKEDYIRVINSFINYVEEADGSFVCDESVKKFAEKLKAFKTLKAKGFVWQGWEEGALDNGMCIIGCQIPENNWDTDVVKDLDALFGGEE